MRWLFRIFLFWALMAPVAYFWGMPGLASYVESQTRAQNHAECLRQWQAQPAPSGGNAALGRRYCDCVIEPLHFTGRDLFDMARNRHLPPHLAQAMSAQAIHCSGQAQHWLQTPHPSPAPAHPGGKEQIQPDGSTVIFL